MGVDRGLLRYTENRQFKALIIICLPGVCSSQSLDEETLDYLPRQLTLFLPILDKMGSLLKRKEKAYEVYLTSIGPFSLYWVVPNQQK